MPVRNVYVHPFIILSPSTLVVSLCALKSGIIFYKVHKLRGSQRDLLTRPEPQPPPGDGVLISEVRRGAVSPVHLSWGHNEAKMMSQWHFKRQPFILSLDVDMITCAEGHAIKRLSLSDRMKQTLRKQRGDIREFSLHIYINIHHYKCIIYIFLFCLILMEFPARPGARALPVLYSLSQLFDLYKWDQISFWNEIYTYIIRSPWSNIGFQVLGFTTWQQFSKYVHSSIHYSKPFLFLHVSGCRAHKTEDCLRHWRC